MSKQLPEALLDLALKWNVQGAERKDTHKARHAHTILQRMLTEAEIHNPFWDLEGRYWLTNYAKSVLAKMHDEFSKAPEQGKELVDSVLKTLLLTPTRGNRRNLGDWRRESRIASHVDVESWIQKEVVGRPISITESCKRIAKSGNYGLKWGTIRNIYYRVKSRRGIEHDMDFPSLTKFVIDNWKYPTAPNASMVMAVIRL